MSYDLEETRRLFQLTLLRPLRDWSNRRAGLSAYDKACAITGDILSPAPDSTLCEVHHIVPVSDRGPDSIRNLLLLSPTAHRAFEAGLISLDDEGKVLRSPRLGPTELRGRMERPGYAWLPRIISQRPASAYLRWHRENRFIAS